ncbi:MAG: endonuclease/exonuclease/phosphatase family protein [Bacteroidales bacterium]|nr:endonuclease/exonuclease/phosphatase family protein [Bacteroidales bacterium]
MAEKEKKKEKRHSFGRRVLIFLVGIFAVVGLLSMFLCAINPILSPNYFVLTSYFGVAFWPIFFFNLLILLILILLKARKAILYPLLALILAIPGFLKSCSVKKAMIDEGNIKIMSYNVAHLRDITDNQRKRASVKEELIEIINEQNPDVICFQEINMREKELNGFVEKINLNYYHINNDGNILFSRYPIEDDEFTEQFNEIAELGFAKLIDAGGFGKFYVECVHLQSFSISKEEIEFLRDAKHYVENSETMGKSLISKLKYGFQKRTKDTKLIVGNMPKNGIPIIICGDFNDTPMSYTYHQMRNVGMKDAFLQVGNGIGKTYCGKLPLLRIDYFWYSENIVPMTFTRLKRKISDHYPIIMTFNVSH